MKRALLTFVSALTAIAAGTESKVKLPNSRADVARGEKLFQVHCALCHGPKGEGGRGPMLSKAKLGRAPDDAALVKVIDNGIRGTEMPGAGAMSEREVRQTAAFVRSLGKLPQKPVPGNPAQGAKIYLGKGACAGCHSISGEGGFSGPDLTGIGERRSPEFLRESVVSPEEFVSEDYLLVSVMPKNGVGSTGVRLNEDSFSIQLREDSGSLRSFWKSELAKIDRLKGKSRMPAYKGPKFTDEDLTDLVAYLASLKGAK